MATTTPNIGLNVVPSGDYTKYFDEWRKEMASDEDTSNMMKIDTAIGSLNDDMISVKQNKQDKLTFDTAPTAGSANPVTSGGVRTALNEKADVTSLDAHTSNTSNPHCVTAEQVGADTSGTAANAVSAHDASDAAHSDIRTRIGTLSTVVDGKQDAATLELDVQAAGFTKNEGTYIKPTSGIPKTDLASDVQAVLTSAAKIASGIYIGTGTYGADNPNILTFDFEPKLVIMLGYLRENEGWVPQFGQTTSTDMGANTVIVADVLTTTYEKKRGFVHNNIYSSTNSCYAKKSANGKTVYWYDTGSSEGQFNSSDLVYYYAAIG